MVTIYWKGLQYYTEITNRNDSVPEKLQVY